MTNDEMKPGRFLAIQQNRNRLAFIIENLKSGNRIQVTTYTRSTVYDSRHIEWFKNDSKGTWVRQGRKSVCINYCSIRAVA